MLKTKIQNVDRKSLWGKKHIFQGKRSNTVPPGPGPGLGCDESWLRGGEGGGGCVAESRPAMRRHSSSTEVHLEGLWSQLTAEALAEDRTC